MTVAPPLAESTTGGETALESTSCRVILGKCQEISPSLVRSQRCTLQTRQLYDKRPPAELVPLKSKQARWIGVPELAAEALDEMVRGRSDIDGPLFPAAVRDGLGVGYLRHSNFIRRTFHPAVEDLARSDSAFHRLRFHDLRHSAASIWIQRGAPATVVAAQLGHSTPGLHPAHLRPPLRGGRGECCCPDPLRQPGRNWADRPSTKVSCPEKGPLTCVEAMGLEPTTPCLQSRCSSQLSYAPVPAR